MLCFDPPTWHNAKQQHRATWSAKTCGGCKHPTCILSFRAPQQQPIKWNDQIMPQRPSHCRNLRKNTKMLLALPQCSLTTSVMIGHIYACIFSHARIQGVQSDSLQSFRAVGAGQAVDTWCCMPFLHMQHQQLFYMYCKGVIKHNIFCFL